MRQTQVDTATADSTGLRFATPLAFRAPLAVRVGTAAGDVVRQVTIDRREQTVRIDGLPGPPTMVAFDDDNAVVKSLDFDQPTAWLATLLDATPAPVAAGLGHRAAWRSGRPTPSPARRWSRRRAGPTTS